MVLAHDDPVRLAQRNTVGTALRRASAKFGSRIALRYDERTWAYAELDRAANAVARGLLALGLRPGDRIVAFGRNSDAYLLAWFGCVRAGLIHVPASFALGAAELAYVIEQSEARALFFDEALVIVASDAAARSGVTLRGTFVDGGEFDVLRFAQSDAGDVDLAGPRDEELAQLLYTSGTTGAPKGAMMSHRALVAEYASAVMALDFAATDRALAALPLYHCAQMHVFTMPQLLVGAQTRLVRAPEPALCLRLIEEERITSFFAPPTVWISLLRRDDFDRRDLSSLERLYYGASIMPVPVLEELRRRLPRARPYNCYGQTEIAPLATVLGPAEHDDRPASAGRAVSMSRRVSSTERCGTSRRANAARSCTARRTSAMVIGTRRPRPSRPSPGAGSIRATSATATTPASSTSSTASRTSSIQAASSSRAARSRKRSSRTRRSRRSP